jgi:hypothetical protein
MDATRLRQEHKAAHVRDDWDSEGHVRLTTMSVNVIQ